jgi:hypothetical protein
MLNPLHMQRGGSGGVSHSAGRILIVGLHSEGHPQMLAAASARGLEVRSAQARHRFRDSCCPRLSRVSMGTHSRLLVITLVDLARNLLAKNERAGPAD